MPKQHMFDTVIDELTDWIETTADALADAVRVGTRAPFAAPLSEPEKLAYYDAMLFHPDGSANVEGRQALAQRLGLREFANVLARVMLERDKKISRVQEHEPNISPDIPNDV